jgi:GNAT superfamily N-acetyltransferase
MKANQKTPMEVGFRRLGHASARVKVCDALPEHMRGGTREVHELWTDPKGRRTGHATSLMHSICREADQRGIVLIVIVAPFSKDGESNGMTKDKLDAWYRTEFGFQTMQARDPLILVRPVEATPKVRLRLSPVTMAVIQRAMQ